MTARPRLPSCALPSLPTGALIAARGRRGPTVTIVLESVSCEECRDLLDRLVSETAAIAEWGARLRCAFPEAVEQLGSLLHVVAECDVLSDPSRSLNVAAPGLIIADEWGEVYFQVEHCADHVLPEGSEIAEWTRFIAIQCPECEQPEGEWKSI